jgi:hypothetical protein
MRLERLELMKALVKKELGSGNVKLSKLNELIPGFGR